MNDYQPTESSQTFYFGQTPPKYKSEGDTPSLTTAVGKVRNNEALSQPFRQHPRHDPRKSSSGSLSKSNNPPKLIENEPKIVIVKNRNNDGKDNMAGMNNNVASVKNLNGAKLPPKEREQEEINREFQNELLKAKSKLMKVQKSTYLGDSQDTPPAPPAPVMPPPAPGAPPPPPAISLVKTPVKVNPRPVSKPLPPSNLNAREELMMAIRNKGGLGGLRKTGISNF